MGQAAEVQGALLSPWAGERSPEDTENSWHKWEPKGKQVRLGV